MSILKYKLMHVATSSSIFNLQSIVSYLCPLHKIILP